MKRPQKGDNLTKKDQKAAKKIADLIIKNSKKILEEGNVFNPEKR